MAIMFLSFVIIGCEPSEDATIIDQNSEGSMIVKSGTFVGSGHDVSGTASIYDSGGNRAVVLDPFSTQAGPDLKVYLSTDEDATTYVSLGDLKSNSGEQSYEIPDGTDLSASGYTFVLIWCEQFTVLFGSAQLQ